MGAWTSLLLTRIRLSILESPGRGSFCPGDDLTGIRPATPRPTQ